MTPIETHPYTKCPLVIGIGNAYRSDDAVGLFVVRRVREQVGEAAVCREEHGDGVTLLETWKASNAVILIDAMQSGAPPGTLRRFDVHARPLPATLLGSSTHAFGVGEAIELARALNQLPRHCLVYGIEGKCFTAGVRLSPKVEAAAYEAIRQVYQQLVLWGV